MQLEKAGSFESVGGYGYVAGIAVQDVVVVEEGEEYVTGGRGFSVVAWAGVRVLFVALIFLIWIFFFFGRGTYWYESVARVSAVMRSE